MQEIHDHHRRPVLGLQHIVDLDDVRVLHGAHGPGLADEPLAEGGVRRALGLEHLQGDGLARHHVCGRPDHTHPTFADATIEMEAAGDHGACDELPHGYH